MEDWDSIKKGTNIRFKRDELGQELIKEFKKTYAYYQYNTPYIAQAILHLIMGQMPHQKAMKIHVDANYLDTRVHVVWFQGQGSGKGRGYNFAGMLCDNLGLTYKPVTEITDAKLLGGWDAEEGWDPDKKRKVKEYIFMPGVLAKGNCNILAMNEASMLFNMKSTQTQKHAMDYYQITMNTHGTKDNLIAKDILHGGGTIELYPDCSLFLSSYVPSRFNEIIATRGFVSRTLNIINEVSSENRFEAQMHSAKYFNVHREAAGHHFGDLVAKMKYIDSYYKDINKLDSGNGVNRAVANFANELKETLTDISKYHRRKLEEYTIRFQEIGYKCMYHNCCLRLGKRIEVEDVAYVHKFLMPIWKEFITYMEESLTQNVREKQKENIVEEDIYIAYKKIINMGNVNDRDGFIPRPLLKKYLQLKVWKCSPATADKRIKFAEREGSLERKKHGRTPIVKVTGKPKLEL